jgi:site-specific recombinase XerD
VEHSRVQFGEAGRAGQAGEPPGGRPVSDLIPLSGSLLASVDWAVGTNRADRGTKQIEADDDLKAVMGWLANAQNSPATFSNYRKEILRILLWCAKEANKPLSSLMYEDFLRYREFLRNPPPDYIGVSHPIGHAQWRPFRGKLSESSVRQAFSVLHAMFSYLKEAGYLKGNPVRLVTGRGWRVPRLRRKPLSIEALDAIFAYIAAMEDGPEKVRARWLFALLYRTGLRISEVTNGKMGDFFKETTEIDDKIGGKKIAEMWFIHVVGKGRKERDVVVPPLLVEEMKAYRAFYGLPELPMPGDDRPLILRLSGKAEALKRSGLNATLKNMLKMADAWLAEQGHPLAGQLASIHAHLFRHTAATHWLDNGANLADVRDNLGHDDISTTSIYVNPDKSRRFEGIKNAQEKQKP